MKSSNKVLEYFENPVNVGSFDKNDINVGTGLVGSPACGDVVKIQIKVEDGIIVDTKFKTFGCDSAIAATSWTVQWLCGKTLEQALSIENADIAKDLSLSKIKTHCSVLAREAIEAAVEDYNNKNNLSDCSNK